MVRRASCACIMRECVCMLQNPQKNAQKSPYALKHGTARVCARVRPRIMRACVCASRVRYGACACMRARVCTPASARRPAYARVCPRRPAYARVYARVCPRARGVRASALRVSACVCARRVCLRACARRACLHAPACAGLPAPARVCPRSRSAPPRMPAPAQRASAHTRRAPAPARRACPRAAHACPRMRMHACTRRHPFGVPMHAYMRALYTFGIEQPFKRVSSPFFGSGYDLTS